MYILLLYRRARVGCTTLNFDKRLHIYLLKICKFLLSAAGGWQAAEWLCQSDYVREGDPMINYTNFVSPVKSTHVPTVVIIGNGILIFGPCQLAAPFPCHCLWWEISFGFIMFSFGFTCTLFFALCPWGIPVWHSWPCQECRRSPRLGWTWSEGQAAVLCLQSTQITALAFLLKALPNNTPRVFTTWGGNPCYKPAKIHHKECKDRADCGARISKLRAVQNPKQNSVTVLELHSQCELIS